MGQIRRCASAKYFKELSTSFLITFGNDELRPRAPVVVNKTAKFKRLLKVKGIHLGSEKDSWVLSSIYFINNLIIAKVMSVLMRFHLTSFSVMPKTLSVLEWILPFSHHFHEDECTFESIFTLMRFRRKRSAS